MQNKSNQKKIYQKNLCQNAKINIFIWDVRITNGCFSFVFLFVCLFLSLYIFQISWSQLRLATNFNGLFKTKGLNHKLTVGRRKPFSTYQSAIQGLVLAAFMEPSFFSVSESVSCSVGSDSLPPQERLPTRFLCSWDFPGKNVGVAIPFSKEPHQPRDRTQIS